jgi:hypothetical protein
LPQYVELSWDEPRELREVQIVFDTGFERPLTLTHSERFNEKITRGPQPETVRSYTVAVECGDRWVEVAHVHGNYQRRRVHNFDCLTANRVRVTCEATNGVEEARVFEVRAYG